MSIDVASPCRHAQVTVPFTGEIDHDNAHQIPDAVGAALTDGSGDAVEVLVDLAAVRFMGAAALGALVRSRNDCRRRGVDLHVHCPNAQLRHLFAITGLTSLLGTSGT